MTGAWPARRRSAGVCSKGPFRYRAKSCVAGQHPICPDSSTARSARRRRARGQFFGMLRLRVLLMRVAASGRRCSSTQRRGCCPDDDSSHGAWPGWALTCCGRLAAALRRCVDFSSNALHLFFSRHSLSTNNPDHAWQARPTTGFGCSLRPRAAARSQRRAK